MRVIGRFPDQRQVGFAVDSLRNIGFTRKEMIISDFNKEQNFRTVEEAAEEMIFIKSERDGLGEFKPFVDGIEGLQNREGIILALEAPKHSYEEIRSIMEQTGAIEIFID